MRQTYAMDTRAAVNQRRGGGVMSRQCKPTIWTRLYGWLTYPIFCALAFTTGTYWFQLPETTLRHRWWLWVCSNQWGSYEMREGRLDFTSAGEGGE
jgi:hypothetical protein